MAHINPHINFNGNAEEAFHFYRSVFGGEFSRILRFQDLTHPGFDIPEKDKNKIMLITLPIGDTTLLANDVPEILWRVNENENRSKISVQTETREEAEKIFHGLSAGGAIEMPLSDSPWSTYFGMFRDKYGIEWIVEFDPNRTGEK